VLEQSAWGFNILFEFCTCKHGRSWNLWEAVALSPERQVQDAAKLASNWRINRQKKNWPELKKAAYSRNPSACIPSTVWETKFPTHTKQRAKLFFCMY